MNDNAKKSAKVALFASLIVAMILPFSGVQIIKAEEIRSDVGEFSAYEQLLLDNGEGLQDLSDDEKIKYVHNLRTFIDSLDGYEAKIFEKINKFAIAKKEIDKAQEQEKSDEDIKKLEKDMHRLHFELEDLGVTTQAKLHANPIYWAEKIIEVKNDIESANTNKVNGFDKESNIHYVHQTDLALKRIALTSAPCIPLDLATFYCTTLAYGWNAGTTVSNLLFVFYSGEVDFFSSVCLDSSTHHSSVDFAMETERLAKSILNHHAVSKNTYNLNFGDSGDCSNNTVSQFIEATYRVATKTSINDISLD